MEPNKITMETNELNKLTAWRIYQADLKRATLLKSSMSDTHTSITQQEVFKKLLDFYHDNQLKK